jgi:hypothetical protein
MVVDAIRVMACSYAYLSIGSSISSSIVIAQLSSDFYLHKYNGE